MYFFVFLTRTGSGSKMKTELSVDLGRLCKHVCDQFLFRLVKVFVIIS